MRVALISTYELGRQPFSLASAAAWLGRAGHRVACADVSVEALDENLFREADFIAFSLPMHTATRLAAPLIGRARAVNPDARLCCFGLYAPLNESYLRTLGVTAILGGEFEAALVRTVEDADLAQPAVSFERLSFQVPVRDALPALHRYPRLVAGGERRVAGYTETSRGCKHFCRHCPVVPVYGGQFRVVPVNIAIEDIRRQAAAGASHITFGDPDFFNGPGHAARVMEAFHREFPGLTYDATIKIEHLRTERRLLPLLRATGCLFVTSAVESVDDALLEKLDKGHTRADFVAVAREFAELGLTLAPTFLPFTPWTTRAGYAELLRALVDLNLVDNVSPVQLALRLLIPRGSRMLELDGMRAAIRGFDEPALLHRWRHHDPDVDDLAARVLSIVTRQQSRGATRRDIFASVWRAAADEALPENFNLVPRAAIPYLEEPWYC